MRLGLTHRKNVHVVFLPASATVGAVLCEARERHTMFAPPAMAASIPLSSYWDIPAYTISTSGTSISPDTVCQGPMSILSSVIVPLLPQKCNKSPKARI